MLKKIIVAAAMGTMLLIAGCGKEKTAVPKEINITYVKAPLNIPSILEKNREKICYLTRKAKEVENTYSQTSFHLFTF